MGFAGGGRLLTVVVVVALAAGCSSGGKRSDDTGTSAGARNPGATAVELNALKKASTRGASIRSEHAFARSVFGRFSATPDEFLREHGAAFGIVEGGLQLGHPTESSSALGTVTRYDLTASDVPVSGAAITVYQDPQDAISMVLATGPSRVEIAGSATVGEQAAIAVADRIGLGGVVPTARRVVADLDGDSVASDQVWDVLYQAPGKPEFSVLVDAVTSKIRTSYEDVYDDVACAAKPGAKVPVALPATSPADDPVVVAGQQVLAPVLEYYRSRFGRSGYDGEGGSVRFVHGQRSAWTGDGRISLATGEAVLDVVGHEFTHAVVGASGRLSLDPLGRAINESYGDVFASFIDGNWLIGEQTPKVRRDLSKRRTSADFATLPAGTISHPNNDRGCSHANSTILSHAAYLAVNGCPAKDSGPDGYCRGVKSRIGVRQAEQVYYETITRLAPGHDFAAVRDEVVHACDRLLVGHRFDVRPQDCAALINAFHAIGYGPADIDSDGIVDAADNCSDVFNPDQAPSTEEGVGAACLTTAPVSEPPPPPETTTTTSTTTPPAVTPPPTSAPAAGNLDVLVVETKTKAATQGVCGLGANQQVPTAIRHTLAYYYGDTATLARIAKQEVKPVTGKWFVYACQGTRLMVSRVKVIGTRLTVEAARALVAKEAKLASVTSGFTQVAGPEDGQTGTVKAAEIYA